MIIVTLDMLGLLPVLIFSFYLALLTFLAMFKKLRRFDVQSEKDARFAILVPAHNEELVIDQTLSSLEEINYPRNLFDVYVIADNCTDNTAAVARRTGVNVLERFDNVNIGKGQALRWCLDQLMRSEKAYDAFCIVDADTVVSGNFLTVMGAYLRDGADCIQSSDMVQPQPGRWSPEMTRVAFILHNYVRPLGKMVIGCSSGLNGNGMCFSRKLIATSPWSSYSRVEDLEHSLQLALEGIRIQFAPEAVVRAIMPSDPHNAETQRKRWEMGRFPLIRKYTGRLLAEAIKQRSVMIADMFMELVTPAFVNLVLVTVLGLAANLLILLGLNPPGMRVILLVWSSALLLEIFHVIAGLKVSDADPGAYLALLNFPRFAVWKLAIYLKTMLKGDDRTWVRTARENRGTNAVDR